jgi:hypothetical protein
VYGLLCSREGLPIAVEVFDGNTADPSALRAQVEKAKDRLPSAAWCWSGIVVGTVVNRHCAG